METTPERRGFYTEIIEDQGDEQKECLAFFTFDGPVEANKPVLLTLQSARVIRDALSAAIDHGMRIFGRRVTVELYDIDREAIEYAVSFLYGLRPINNREIVASERALIALRDLLERARKVADEGSA